MILEYSGYLGNIWNHQVHLAHLVFKCSTRPLLGARALLQQTVAADPLQREFQQEAWSCHCENHPQVCYVFSSCCFVSADFRGAPLGLIPRAVTDFSTGSVRS